MLKKILIVVAILIAIPLVMGIFAKDEYTIERSVTINKPKQAVFDFIKMLKNQTQFSKWAKMDPNAKMTYTGTDGTVGFVSAWQSDNKDVGQGEQTISGIKDGERVDYDLHFIKPFEGHSVAYLTTTAAGDNQTKVVWGFQGKKNYLMRVMCVFMDMDKMIGNDLQTGLDNLKGLPEK